MPLPESGGLLESMGDLKHAEIILMPPDDLQADRKPATTESAGHGQRGRTGDGNVVAGRIQSI